MFLYLYWRRRSAAELCLYWWSLFQVPVKKAQLHKEIIYIIYLGRQRFDAIIHMLVMGLWRCLPLNLTCTGDIVVYHFVSYKLNCNTSRINGKQGNLNCMQIIKHAVSTFQGSTLDYHSNTKIENNSNQR